MAKDYFRVKDIHSLVTDKRMVRISKDGKFATVNYSDGGRWYRRKDENSDWVLYAEKVCTNF